MIHYWVKVVGPGVVRLDHVGEEIDARVGSTRENDLTRSRKTRENRMKQNIGYYMEIDKALHSMYYKKL